MLTHQTRVLIGNPSPLKMRFNDKELKELAERESVMQGIMHHMKPQNNDWYEWYQNSPYKERIFKLVNNFLFYYRINEPLEPLGVIVIENMEVAYETTNSAAFTFSLSGCDGKHVFACRCEEDLNQWVAALKSSSYSYWRNCKTVLEAKLRILKNRDQKGSTVENPPSTVMVDKLLKSTFYSYEAYHNSQSPTSSTSSYARSAPVDNLIDL